MCEGNPAPIDCREELLESAAATISKELADFLVSCLVFLFFFLFLPFSNIITSKYRNKKLFSQAFFPPESLLHRSVSPLLPPLSIFASKSVLNNQNFKKLFPDYWLSKWTVRSSAMVRKRWNKVVITPRFFHLNVLCPKLLGTMPNAFQKKKKNVLGPR